jgi:methionyl-tRNA synthetase
MNKEQKEPRGAFYITTTLPYVNSKPHIGFALEVIRADAIARYKRLMGYDVFFNTGTDEHGTKIHQTAQEKGIDTQEFVDQNAEAFKVLKEKLNLSYDKFIRTTDKEHKEAAVEFWEKCKEAGFIYKKNYTGLYCIGCEMFVTEKELVNDECPHHPGKKPDNLSEENYFFKFSEFTDDLKKYYKDNPEFVIPNSRFNEMKALVDGGLEDFSISRIKEKMPWGVSVPGDDEQVMYVWFDALVNYISTLGWPNEEGDFKKFWLDGETVQICGKDNTQHQSARWQAMLKSIGLPYTNTVLVNGFVTSNGQKMSKSVGNVIDPNEIVDEYGADALRYFVLRELHPTEDSDFTDEKFKEAYNANLANGVGNLTNRILKLAEDHLDSPVDVSSRLRFFDPFMEAFDKYDYASAIDMLWKGVGILDEQIQKEEPFKVVKVDLEKGKKLIEELVLGLADVAYHLQPFLPETADKMFEAIKENKKPETPLFERKN